MLNEVKNIEHLFKSVDCRKKSWSSKIYTEWNCYTKKNNADLFHLQKNWIFNQGIILLIIYIH